MNVVPCSRQDRIKRLQANTCSSQLEMTSICNGDWNKSAPCLVTIICCVRDLVYFSVVLSVLSSCETVIHGFEKNKGLVSSTADGTMNNNTAHSYFCRMKCTT